MSTAEHHAMYRRPWPGPQSISTASWYQAPLTTYDNETGQVYTERMVQVPKKQKVNWINEFKTASLVKRRQANDEGAASLFDMAKAKVAREMHNLTASHLAGLPSSIGEKLWDEVKDSRLDTFHTWRIFACAFPEMLKSPQRRYFLDVREPVLPLTDYLEGLDSQSVSWLSCLRINPRNLDRSDLVRIARLRNMAVLDLSDDVSIDDRRATQMDERIFKTWSELARDGQAFKHLRVMLMRGQEAVSAWIFRYLDSFPSLCFLILSDCRRIHQRNRAEWTAEAALRGWEARHGKKSAKSLKDLIDDGDFHLGSVSACYYHSRDALGELATQNHQTSTLDQLPLVEAWIRRPKPWLHLIEEFPGTRTVWFDNTNKTKQRAATVAEARRSGTIAPALAGAARDPPSVRNKCKSQSNDEFTTPTRGEELTKRTREELTTRRREEFTTREELTTPMREELTTRRREEPTKRTSKTMSSPGEDPKSPPHKRSTTMVRSRRKNLDQILADFG